MNSINRYAADQPVRTVVLDGLSWRDIALGAALMLLLVLFFIALAAVRDKRHRRLAPGEGGDPSAPGSRTSMTDERRAS